MLGESSVGKLTHSLARKIAIDADAFGAVAVADADDDDDDDERLANISNVA